MIKIDGEKIKSLRESQELTQLYMATAVGVTTDTISRWENKRYPTIKVENGQKLAEALGVELKDILLVEEAPPESPITGGPAGEGFRKNDRKFPLVPLVLITAIVLTAAAWSLRFFHGENSTIKLRAARTMPQHTLPGSPFPVIVTVAHDGDTPLSIILKENLPSGCKVVETSPKVGTPGNSTELKWIRKIKGTARFSYLAILESASSSSDFSGTIAASTNDEPVEVGGNGTIAIGNSHWADSDGDNNISDQEILTVFDYYSGIDNFTIDIEFIEKMWLGKSYAWDEKTKDISIIE